MVPRSKHTQRVASELAANLVLLALTYTYICIRLAAIRAHGPGHPGAQVELLAAPLVVLAVVRVLFAVMDERLFRRVTAVVDVTAARNELQPYREDVVLRQCDLGDCELTGDAVCGLCGRAVCEEHRPPHAQQERARLARPLNATYIVLRILVFFVGFVLLARSVYASPFDAAAVTEERLVMQLVLSLVCVGALVLASGNKDRVEQTLERLLPWTRGRRWPAEAAATLFTAFTGLLVYSTALGIIIHAHSNFTWVPIY